MTEPLPIAKSREWIHLLPKMANRHGLIAGATGTGKTVTLQVMTERFSAGGGLLDGLLGGVTGPLGGRREGAAEAMVKSAARSIGSQIGRNLIRGVLGSLLGGKR
jgi:hypothetical protein